MQILQKLIIRIFFPDNYPKNFQKITDYETTDKTTTKWRITKIDQIMQPTNLPLFDDPIQFTYLGDQCQGAIAFPRMAIPFIFWSGTVVVI